MAFLRRNSLALLSGLLLTFSFPNFLFHEPSLMGSMLAFAALVPLLRALEGKSVGEAWRLGYACGAAFFVLSLNWITNVGPMGPGAYPAWLALSAFLALYVALFAAITARGRASRWPLEALWLPALWTLLEWVRERLFTGLPWVSLGSSQAPNAALLPLASVAGVYGLHFAVALGNLLLYRAWRRTWSRAQWAAGLSALALVLALRLASSLPAPQPSFKAAVLQGNIDQDQAWTEDYRHRIMGAYGELARQAVGQGAKLLVLPESTFPGFFNEDGPEARAFKAFASREKVALLMGSSLAQDGGRSYANGAVFIDSRGNTHFYLKRHLVPFGEFIPFRRRIPVLDRVMRQMGLADFRAGQAAALFEDGNLRLSPLICYESVYGREALDPPRGLLAVVTLDTWFGNSSAPRYHLMHAQLRAAEGGRFVVRAAATGISAIVAPGGRILRSIPLNTAGMALAEVDSRAGSLYARFGNWFLWVCALFLGLALAPIPKKYR